MTDVRQGPSSGAEPVLREHLARPRCPGPLRDPDASSRTTNPACGDVLALDLAVAGGRIAAVGQVVLGCPAARAVASFLAERIVGMTIEEARRLDERALDEAIGGLPRGKRHALQLAAEALAAALAGI